MTWYSWVQIACVAVIVGVAAVNGYFLFVGGDRIEEE